MSVPELVKKFHNENPMVIRTAVLKEDNWDTVEPDMQSTSPINYITDDFPLLFTEHYAANTMRQNDVNNTLQTEADRTGSHDHLAEPILGGSSLHQLSTPGNVAPGSILFNGSSSCSSEGRGDGESTEPHDLELATVSAPSIISFTGAAANAMPSTTSMPHATSTRLEDVPAHAGQRWAVAVDRVLVTLVEASAPVAPTTTPHANMPAPSLQHIEGPVGPSWNEMVDQ
jgi:hypothetical protein